MVDAKAIQQALDKLKQSTERVKFNQTVDLIITLKDIDLKKPDQQVDFFTSLPHGKGKDVKVAGLVGSDLIDAAKKELDFALSDSDFAQFASKKSDVKNMASTYDYFVAQANVMPKVAQSFGRILGPRNKMPNPKAGCVVPPKTSLTQVKERLQKMVRISARKDPHIQVAVGTQNMDAQQIIENITEAYNQTVAHLPQGINNVKKVLVKLTMSKVERVA